MNEAKEATKLSDNIELALSCVNNGFICHYMKRDVSDTMHIMSKDSTSYCRVYWFHDDNDTVYLEWLSVSEHCRKRGVGLYLQLLREDIGRILGAKTSMLWVTKDSWMHKWYKRRGYVDDIDYLKEDNAVWMKRKLL